MATRTRPFLMAGAALASAAAIVVATPALMPAGTAVSAAAYTPTKLSTAKYDLTSLSDITPANLNNAYFNGYGGYIGSAPPDGNGNPDPYYPYISDYSVTGAPGVAYFIVDNVVKTFDPSFNLDNYYFEVGSYNYATFGEAGAIASGATAVLYVGASEVPVIGPALGSLVLAAQNFPTVVTQGIVAASQAVVPKFNVGPVALGGGILTTLYFTGATPDGSYNYGSPGLSAILGYVNHSLTAGTATATAATFKALAAASGTHAAAANPVAGVVGYFIGNGANAAADCTGSACNGGAGGILFGNGGAGANGGTGGSAGFFFGNGGRGGDGVDASGTTPATFVAATAGGNGGRGGFLFGNGGAGGNGGSDGVNLPGDSTAGDGGAGGNAGLFSGTGGAGGGGGSALATDGSAYGGYGGNGGSGGIVGAGGKGGDAGGATATSSDPSTIDDNGVPTGPEAVGGDGGKGGAATLGNAGAGGDGASGIGHGTANAWGGWGGNGGSSTVGNGGKGGNGDDGNAADSTGSAIGGSGGAGGSTLSGTAGSGGNAGSSTKPVGSTTGENFGGDGGKGGSGTVGSKGGSGGTGGNATGGGEAGSVFGGFGGSAGSGGIGGSSGTPGTNGTPDPGAAASASAQKVSAAASSSSSSSSAGSTAKKPAKAPRHAKADNS